MSTTRERAKEISRQVVSGKTLVFALEKIDQLLCEAQAAIPFDAPNLHKDWITREVNEGKLSSVVLRLDDKPIGAITYAIIEDITRELLITSAYISDASIEFSKALHVFVLKLLDFENCESARFHTVRLGLIHNALKHGWHVREIVLAIKRKKSHG